MRNLMRINNYYNRIEAVKDLRAAIQQALNVGITKEQIEAILPGDLEELGWRKLDKITEAIKKLEVIKQP